MVDSKQKIEKCSVEGDARSVSCVALYFTAH